MPFPPVMRALAADPSLANSVKWFFERRKGAFCDHKSGSVFKLDYKCQIMNSSGSEQAGTQFDTIILKERCSPPLKYIHDRVTVCPTQHSKLGCLGT